MNACNPANNDPILDGIQTLLTVSVRVCNMIFPHVDVVSRAASRNLVDFLIIVGADDDDDEIGFDADAGSDVETLT